MTYKEFLEIEKNIDISNIKFKNKCIYPLIKHGLLFNRLVPLSKSYTVKPSKSKIIKKLFADFFYKIITQKNIKKCDFLFVDSTTYRRLNYKNKHFSIFSDSTIELLNLKNTVVLEETLCEYKRPYFSKNVIYENWFVQKVFIKSKFFKTKFTINYDTFQQLFNSFNVKISDKELQLFLTKLDFFEKTYTKLIKKIKPKVVFIICAYNYKHMILTNVCKTLNIPVIELQHGSIYNKHLGYVYKQNCGNDFFPDYLFAYGNYFKQQILSSSKMFTEQQIKVIGSAFLEFYNKTNIPIQNTQLNSFTQNKKVILFSGQESVQNEIKAFLNKLLPILPTEYVLILKTHPAEKNAKEFYKSLFANKNFYLEESENILNLIKISDIHTTVYSTVFFEALYFNKPTILFYSEKYSSAVEHFVNNTWCFMAKNETDFAKLLTTNFDMESIQNTNDFYAKGVSENMKEQINNF